MVCRTPGIRVASRPEEAGRNQDCDTSFDGVLEAVSAGSTGHIGHTDKVSDPCGSTCVIPNDAAKSTRMRIDRIWNISLLRESCCAAKRRQNKNIIE